MGDAYEHFPYMGPIRGRYGQIIGTAQELLDLDEIGRKSVLCELPIAITTSDALGKNQVMNFQTERENPVRLTDPWRNLDFDKTGLPSGRRYRRLWPNAVGVVPIHALERRAVAQARVDLNGLVRVVKRIDIYLHRDEHARRRLVDDSENRLTANHHDLSLTRHSGRRCDQVLELSSLQGGSDRLEDLAALRLTEQPGEWRVLP